MNHLPTKAFLFFESPLLAVRIFMAMPFLMLVQTSAIKLSLAMLTYPSKFELRLWTPRPALLATARMMLSVAVVVAAALHLYTTGLEGAFVVTAVVSILHQKKETPSRICFLRREDAVSYGCAVASAKKQTATVAVAGCGSVAVACCGSVAVVC